MEDFSFTYRYEQSLKEEVEEYFKNLRENAFAFITSREGVYLSAMLIVILISYILLKNRVRTDEQA